MDELTKEHKNIADTLHRKYWSDLRKHHPEVAKLEDENITLRASLSAENDARKRLEEGRNLFIEDAHEASIKREKLWQKMTETESKLSAANERAEKAERERNEARAIVCRAINFIKIIFGEYGIKIHVYNHEEAQSILSSFTSNPCPHETELAKVREFVEGRLAHCVADQRGAYQDVLGELRRLSGTQ